MKRFLAGAVFSVVMASSAWGAGGLINGDLSGAGSFFTPGVDIYGPKCLAPTIIRARMHEFGSVDTHHVIVTCVEPVSKRGKGDKELARSSNVGTPWRNPGEWAETPTGCTEALVIVGCEDTELCEGNYHVEIECVNSLFGSAYSTPKFNR